MPKPISMLPNQSSDKLPFRDLGIGNLKIWDEGGKSMASKRSMQCIRISLF